MAAAEAGVLYASDDDEGVNSFFVRALYDFSSEDASSLSFERGALIEVLTQLESGWWDGLLGNDVRGWFPSNYVEVISDEEAEAELRARGIEFDEADEEEEEQNDAAASDGASQRSGKAVLSGFDLGPDYESVRQLMEDDGASGNAFEQLAEAAAFGAASGSSHSAAGGPDRARAGSSASAVPATTSPARSTPRAGPSERERLRSHSTAATASIVPQSRPRAATNVASSATASLQAPQGRERALSAAAQGSRARSRSRKDEADFWVPKVTDRGEIMYYNTRTGAQSHDLPDGHESGDSRSASSMHMSDDDEMLSDRSSESRREALQGQAALSPQGAAVSANVFNRHTSTVYIDSDGASGSAASSRLRSGSMASSMTAQSSNTATSARRNPLDSMPDPRDVRPPWKVREALDERSFFFYNTETRETRYDVPPGALISRTRDTLEELADEPRSATARVSSLPTLESEESETEGDGRPVARAPGKSPKLRRDGSRRPMSIPPAMSDAPRSMMLEAEQALALQKTLEPDSAQALSVLVETAADTISHLASVAAEAIGSDGKSEADRAVVPDPEDALSDHSRLGGATSAVVRAIRDLLYAAGTLGIPQLDLAPIAELCVQPGDEDAATGPVGAFHAALVALQQKSPSSSARDQATVQQAVSAPPGLLALSKKVNATVSKLVLSARAVVEQPMLEGGRGTELADSQIEKLSSHRQRVRDDAMDLARALGALGSEIERAKVSRGAAIPWSRRIHGVVDSGSGTAGVGLQVLGGGSAAGWRGNGFVLPTPTEAATLRAEALGTFHNPFELTKDAQQALNSGKIALRRKPREPLSRALIDERIRRQHDDLVRHLSDLALMIQHGGELPNGQTNGDAVAPDAVSRALTRASFRSVLAQVRLVLVRFGSLMNLVEDADIAAVLDVDGPSEDEPLEAQERTRLMVGITKARLALGTLANVKQAAYDHSAAMLIDVQDLSMSLPYSGADLAVSEQLLLQTRELTSVVQRQLSLLLELVDIAEAQGSQTLSHIGARSKVYGIDDVLVSTLMSDDAARVSPGRDEGARGAGDADSSYDGESAEDEVMYLGPGLAVPNGPPSSRHDVVRSAPSLSPAVPPSNKSYSTSVRGGLGMRTRSTSVTTGASIGSQESAARTMSQRRGTTDHGDDDEEHTARVKSSNKMKRFFGDDPTAASTDALSLAPSTDARAPPVPPIRQVEEIPWFLEADYAPHDIVMNASGQVKGATLGALMERLTMHNAFDPTFNNTFLMTYRSFTTTEEFLDLLFARFRVKMPPGLSPDEQQVWAEKKQTPIRLRVFNVLKSWIESHFYEGEDDEELKRIKDFALDEMAQSLPMETPSKLLIRLVERRQGDGEQMIRKMVMPTSAPAPILPKNLRKIKFLDIDPTEMARQLTLIDSRLYNRIRPVECLAKAWSRPDGIVVAKGIRDVISANNRVSGWVSEAILVQEDLKKRAAWVKHFVAIADRCYALNNFSSMMAIYSGLNNASLNRLRRTWDAVNQRHLALFENMKVVLAPTKNFSRYRHTLRQLNPPCVPFLGVYLTDLTFIEDGNSDHLKTDERLINFSKRQMTAEKIGEIMIYQSTPYNLTPVQGIQKFIEDNMVESRTDDELFEQSLRLEPREREDEKIARLLQESGFL